MPSSLTKEKSKRKTQSRSHHHARPKFRSVIRVRPLSKKERDDHVVLEALADGSAVALHPSVKELMSPHSVSTVQTGQDTEFPFDLALPSEASQDRVYFKVGQPIALAAMESLKREKRKKTTHLIVSMGLAQSGKSYTCMGNQSNLSKRKSETDGLIPRMIDSLFFQSLHSSTCNQKNVSFAVEVSILQVNQKKSNPSECKIIDLMQPLPSKSPRSSNPVGAIGSLATTLLGSSTKAAPPAQKSRYAELNEPVKVKQDPKSSECVLTNATVKQCSSAEETRLAVQKAFARSRQVTSKKYQCHNFVQIQPVITSKRSGRLVLEGEPIAVLDMAGWEKNGPKSRSHEALSNRDDAHTAVMHCLQAMQHNKELISTYQTAAVPSSKLRQIPFLQHQATMLLQPLFSSKHTNKTSVTLLVNVSPGTKDYSEKKLLLSEINQLHRPSPTIPASTGVGKKQNRKRVETEDSSGSDPVDDFVADSVCKPEKKVDDDYATDLFKNSVDPVKYVNPEDPPISPHLPPPLAPGFSDKKKNTNRPESIVTKNIERFSKSRPSAPFEDETPVDNLTISPKSTSTAGSSSNSGGELSPQDDFEEGIEVSAANKFSYIDTLNKAVRASKKTGRKVFERMTVTTYNENETDIHDHVQQLETENQELMEKVKVLEEKNKELSEENQQLREGTVDATPAAADTAKSTGSNRFDSFLSTIKQSTVDIRTVSADEDCKETESLCDNPCRSPDAIKQHEAWKPACPSIFDNLLMQQMTNMTGGWDQPSKPSYHVVSSVDADYSEQKDAFNPAEKEDEFGGRAPAPYDNELFQHMAMINNL